MIYNEKVFDDNHALSYEIQFIGKTELTTASLEGGIERVKGLINQLFFELDQQRALQLQKDIRDSLRTM